MMDAFIDTIAAVSNETRVRILHFLLTHGKTCVCEFEYSLGMGQARLSTNLTILKKAGFVRVEREGKWAYYYLSPQTPLHLHLLEAITLLAIDTPKKVDVCNTKGKES